MSLLDIFDRCKEHLLREWPMAKATPVAYFFAFCLGIAATAFVYQREINFYEREITVLKERLGDAPKETEYARLSHQDLKIRIQRVGQELRGFQQQVREENRQRESGYDRLRNAATSDEEKRRIYEEHGEEVNKSLVQRQLRLQQFLPRVQALSSEVQIRLPPLQRQVDQALIRTTGIANTFAGTDPIGSVADFVDQLAELLPSGQPNWWELRWQDSIFTFGVLACLYLLALRLWIKPRKEKSSSPPNLQTENVLLEQRNTDLKRQNADLENRIKDSTELRQTETASSIVINNTIINISKE